MVQKEKYITNLLEAKYSDVMKVKTCIYFVDVKPNLDPLIFEETNINVTWFFLDWD